MFFFHISRSPYESIPMMSQKQIQDVSPEAAVVAVLQEQGKSNISSGAESGVKKIMVRRRKPVSSSVLADCNDGSGGGGLRVFDEYLSRSGLESKVYQQEGVSFCLSREASASPNPRVFGGIIADEMGLGKTIVMIGLILANLVLVKRTLIVVPVALISQWVAQLKKTVIDSGFKRDLTIAVYHGSSRRKIVNVSSSGSSGCGGGRGGGWHLVSGTRSKTSTTTRPIDIVITTYGSVAMEVPSSSVSKKKPISSVNSKPRLSLLTFGADRVIFDEAHHMRNKKNRIFRGAMRLLGHTADAADAPDAGAVSRSSRPRIWIVTGTPIQNKISDLKSLCYILGFLPCEVMHAEQQAFIREHYVLRRTKLSVGMISNGAGTDIGDADRGLLKSLEHSNSKVDWSDENELHLSREIHSRAKKTEDRSERLKLYTRMRQMCVMPALITTAVQPGNDAGSSIDVETYNLPVEKYKNALSHQSKINRVVDIVMRELSVDPNRKSLVFCHFRREMLQIRDIIRDRWSNSGSDSDDGNIDIIDGSVSGGRRNRILAASPQILLLQIRTCSEGLNLQAYSDVYFVSPNWNPCVEDQAIARCYRMGQTSQVRVFRFYMTDFVGSGSGGDDGSSIVNAEGEIGEGKEESITTLDNKCEATQERKRILCREFLDRERVCL